MPLFCKYFIISFEILQKGFFQVRTIGYTAYRRYIHIEVPIENHCPIWSYANNTYSVFIDAVVYG